MGEEKEKGLDPGCYQWWYNRAAIFVVLAGLAWLVTIFTESTALVATMTILAALSLITWVVGFVLEKRAELR